MTPAASKRARATKARPKKKKRPTTAARKGAARKGKAANTAGRRKAATQRKAPSNSSRARRWAPRTRLQHALSRCDRLLGEVQLIEVDSVLEKAAYLILREGSSTAVAQKALKALHEHFIDWNEVRISRPSELARMIAGSRKAAALHRVDARVRRLRDMIDQVYNDRNDPSLDFLLEMKTSERFEYLEDVDDLGIHNAYALVQWLSDDERLVLVSPALAKTAQKLGLVASAAVTRVRKELSALAQKNQLVAIQAHLNQLGEREGEWPPSLAELVA
jgi:endonuclease III